MNGDPKQIRGANGHSPATGPEFLTVREVAERLRVHEFTVRRLVDRGKLPAVRVGSRVRIARADLDAFLVKNQWVPEGRYDVPVGRP